MNRIRLCILVLLAYLTVACMPVADSAGRGAELQPSSPLSTPAGATLTAGVSDVSLITTVTDETGAYHFSDLSEATHAVWLDLETLPLPFQLDPGIPSPRLFLEVGQSETSDLFGDRLRFTARYEDGTLSGHVFQDLDQNGELNDQEIALAGVTVIDPGVFVYFIPLPNKDVLDGYEVLDTCSDNSNDRAAGLDSIISITASLDQTRWFYDHWEDGYDADPLTPGATTLVGTLDGGQSQVFRTVNDLSTDPALPTRNEPASSFSYDGRDRIVILGNPINITRNAWPSDVSTVLAGAWEVYDISRWGKSFVIPVGEDIYEPIIGEDFESTQIFVMAEEDNTEVIYDLDGDGPNPATSAVLNRGKSLYLYNPSPRAQVGGVLSGATIQATDRIQVHMLAGDCTGLPGPQPYIARGFHILPQFRLENEYYLATPFFDDSICGVPEPGDRTTRAYIFNSGDSDITINWQTRQDQGSFNAPSKETVQYNNVEFNSGVRFYTDNPNDVFSIIATVDAASSDYDWGYTPISVSELTSEVIFGWAPGTADLDDNGVPDPPTGGGSQNGNMAFVTPVVDTRVYVDLDQDGNADDFDMNGDGDAQDTDVFGNPDWDEPGSRNGVPVRALEVLRVADPTSNDWDLNGAAVYTLHYDEQLAVVWGEDPCASGIEAPHFDGGFTIPPLPVVVLTKDDNLENSGDICMVQPGATINYQITAENIGRSSLVEVVLEDQLPTEYASFVIGSINTNPPASEIRYNDGTYTPTGPSGEADPAVANWQALWDSIEIGQSVNLTFTMQVKPDLASDIALINNIANIQARNLPGVIVSTDLEYPGGPGTETCVDLTPTVTPTPTESPTPTPTPTQETATSTLTPTPTETSTPSGQITLTPTPTESPTPTPTLTNTPTTGDKPKKPTPLSPNQPLPSPTPLVQPPTPTATPPFPTILPNTGQGQPTQSGASILIWSGLILAGILGYGYLNGQH